MESDDSLDRALVSAEIEVPCEEFSSGDSVRPAKTNALDRNGNPRLDSKGNKIQIRKGEYGYFTKCQDGAYWPKADYWSTPCEPGYFQVDTCGQDYLIGPPMRPCSWVCPDAFPSVSSCDFLAKSYKRLCQRLDSDFETERNGNTFEKCCGVSRETARERDCPYHVYMGSDFCNQVGWDKLYLRCIDSGDPNKPANVLGTNCHLFWHMPEDPDEDPDFVRAQYIDAMLVACQNPTDITHPACIKLMRDDPVNTQSLRNYLSGFCAEQVGNPTYNTMCACFYPDKFYTDLRAAFAKYYVIPEDMLNIGGRKCLYTPCALSPLQSEFGVESKCPDLNIQNCIQTINIDSEGGLKDVSFKQQCNFYERNICDPACIAPKTCVGGFCVDKTICKSNADCGTDGVCTNGVCSKKSSLSIWQILLIIIGVIVFIVLVVAAVKHFKRKAAV